MICPFNTIIVPWYHCNVFSAIKRLIAIKRIQNKSFFLHTICVYTVFCMYLCVCTYFVYIYKYKHMHVYIYIYIYIYIFKKNMLCLFMWPWTTKPVIRVNFFEIEIHHTSSESWINKLSIDAWFLESGIWGCKQIKILRKSPLKLSKWSP